VPLLALALAVSALTLIAQESSIHPLEETPLPVRLANAVDSAATYLVQSLWPANLAVLYPYPRSGVPPVRLLVGGLLLVGSTALAVRWWRSRPYVLVGWLWYLGALVPVIGLVQVGMQARADRYTYVPQIGIILAAVWGLTEALPERRRALGLGVAALLLPPCLLLTRAQARLWENSLTLWEHTLAVTGDNPMARLSYGRALWKSRRPDEAIVQLEEALRINPGMGDALVTLGKIHQESGRWEQALACFQAAVEAHPDVASFREPLAILEIEMSKAGKWPRRDP
jgi:tetratricopeptide (TPR) repeat protein